MNPKPLVKLIKNRKRKASELHAEVESTDGPNRWSIAVRSWVVEFQQNRRDESLRALDCLFKDALPVPDLTPERHSQVKDCANYQME